jgi:hypothetical protein
MKNNIPEQILFSDISRIIYEQAKRLLLYINENMKGKEISISYEDYGTAMIVDFLKNETLQINIGYDSNNGSFQVCLYKLTDPQGFEISLSTSDQNELYTLLPSRLADAFRKSTKTEQDVLFVL